MQNTLIKGVRSSRERRAAYREMFVADKKGHCDSFLWFL